MKLLLRDGAVVLSCVSCSQDFTIDPAEPFVPQLRALSYDHYCRVSRLRPAEPADFVPRATSRQVQPAD